MKKYKYTKLPAVAVFFLLVIGLPQEQAEAGLFNRQGTWKEQIQESIGGYQLTIWEECKWSIWKSDCSSAGDGETRNERVYTL
jgi:hypothetical protein